MKIVDAHQELDLRVLPVIRSSKSKTDTGTAMGVDGMAQAGKMCLRAVIKKDSEEEAYAAALSGKDERLVRQVAELTLREFGRHLLDALEGSDLPELVAGAGPAGVASAYPPSRSPSQIKKLPDRRQKEIELLVKATSSKDYATVSEDYDKLALWQVYASLSQREQTSTLIRNIAQDGSLTHWLSSVF